MLLGDEGHGARGARIDFQHVDLAVLDGILGVHQPDHVEPQGQRPGLALDLGDDVGRQGMGRQGAGRVARMDPGLLDVLHDAGDDHVGTVAQRIDVDLDCVGEVAVDQHRVLARHHDGLCHVAVELGVVVDDLHGAAAEHVGRADDDGKADALGDAAGFGDRTRHAVLGLLEAEFLQQADEAVAVFRQIDGVGAGAEDRHAGALQPVGELERRLAAELDDDALEPAAAAAPPR
jgi:hypothetical protein